MGHRFTVLFAGATVAPGARGSNVSVRCFAPGDIGADYYKAFDPEADTGDFTGRSEGTAQWSTCGKDVKLSLIIDVTARSPADDPTKKSSVKIDEIKAAAPLHGPCAPPRQPGG